MGGLKIKIFELGLGAEMDGTLGTPESAATMENVRRSAMRYCELVSLLSQFTIPSVRGDFLAGRILKCDNYENMLRQLDVMRGIFLPRWCSEQQDREVLFTEAGNHFQLLLYESDSIFELSTDATNSCSFKYCAWMPSLRMLRSCPYWAAGRNSAAEPTNGENIFSSLEPDHEYRSRPNELNVNGDADFRSSLANEQDFPNDSRSPLPLTRRLGTQSQRVLRNSSESASSGRGAKPRSRVNRFEQLNVSDSSEYTVSDSDSCDDRGSYPSRRRDRYYKRDVVPPEIFNVDSTESFKSFLSNFERYFSNKFDGNQKDRCRELGRFLEGDVKTAYNAVGGPRIKYRDMRDELLSWYKSQQVGRNAMRRSELKQASMRNGETFKLYCMRLEEMASRAFPTDRSEGAKELKRVLMSTVPGWFAKCVEKREEMKRVVDPRAKVKWADIVSVAEDEDKKRKKRSLLRDSTNNVHPFPEDVRVAVIQDQGSRNTAVSRVIGRSPPNRNFDFKCHYCGKVGHYEKNCWTKHPSLQPRTGRVGGKCFCCGVIGHGYRECPNFQHSNIRFEPTCSHCKGKHLGKDCALSSSPAVVGNQQKDVATENPVGYGRSKSGAIPKDKNGSYKYRNGDPGGKGKGGEVASATGGSTASEALVENCFGSNANFYPLGN